MATGTRMKRLALAALVSGATAGGLMTLVVVLGAMRLGRGESWQSAIATALIAGIGAGLGSGIVVATPPAFVAGAAMCALARRVEAARRASAWAAAGAVIGSLFWAVFAAAAATIVGEPGLSGPGGILIAAILAGAGAALAFRAVARPALGGAR